MGYLHRRQAHRTYQMAASRHAHHMTAAQNGVVAAPLWPPPSC